MATIAQILPGFDSGGVEAHCLEMANACGLAGHRSLVISAGGGMVSALRNSEHFTLPVGDKNPLTACQRAHQLADFLEKEQVQISHYRSRVPGWLTLWARRILAKRGYHLHLVSSYHGFYQAKSSLKRLYNSVMTRADHVVPNSYAVKAHMMARYGALPEDRVTVIPEGIDLADYPLRADRDCLSQRRVLGLPESTMVLLQVGRLSSLKGAAFMAKVLAEFPDRDWLWLLVGEAEKFPDEKARIEQVLSRHKLSPRVRYWGVRGDLPHIYPAADILLSGSLRPEAFGRTVVEAAACAVPAFVPDQGGTAEVVLDGTTGWHYPLGNEKQAVQRLGSVLSLPREARTRVGLSAFAHVRDNYPLRATEQKTLKIYADLLNHEK